jgi:hypothetical protein
MQSAAKSQTPAPFCKALLIGDRAFILVYAFIYLVF